MINLIIFIVMAHVADNSYRHHGRWVLYFLYALYVLGCKIVGDINADSDDKRKSDTTEE